MDKEKTIPPDYTTYCDTHPSHHQCVRVKNIHEGRGRTRRAHVSWVADKPIAAVHLSNITSSFPLLHDDLRMLAKRSIIYDASSKETLSVLTYGSPWALMKSYNPRNAIMSARSTISVPTNTSYGGKNRKFM